jgi:hypothetical protein
MAEPFVDNQGQSDGSGAGSNRAPPVFKSFAVNKMPLERHLHTVEVAGSNPAAPTISTSK